MAWLRIGDNSVTHPKMSLLLEACDLDHQLKNEAFSTFILLATVSAAHLTDAWVEMGMIAQIAPGREKAILDVLVAAGLAERVKVEERWKIRLVLDDEEFVHARKRDEVLIDRRRSADKRRDDLMIPVRVRDGDECRWCGRTVSWGNRSGNRGGTIDSLTSHQDSTVDTLVVACRGCNSKRHEGIDLVLKPEPKEGHAYYTDHTIKLVNETLWAQEQGIQIQPRQTSLTLDQDTTKAAASRQQDNGKAAHGQSGSSTTDAAPTHLAAPATSTAPDLTAPGDDPFADAPAWVTDSLEEILAEKAKAAAKQAAPGPSKEKQAAAESRQQQEGMAAAPDGVAAPDTAAPAPQVTECNETVKPGSNLGHLGDEAGLVGSGRAGEGREGQDRAGNGRSRSRRRGRRGGRKKA